MKIIFTVFCLITLIVSCAFSAEPWHLSIDASLIANQNGYSDNWSGGETGSMNWVFNSNMLAKKALSKKVKVRNTLKLSFGQTHNQDSDTKNWDKAEKSTDLIDFESLFLLTLGSFVDPYLAGRLESQFLDASDPAKNRMINPLRLTESVGAARMLIEEEKRELTVRAGFAFRQFISRDVLDPVTNTRDTETSTDGGLEVVTELVTPLAKERINFNSKLTIFQALFYSESSDLEGTPTGDYWKEVDLNWENIFSADITKYLMVNLYTQLLYDKEISLGGRFKQTLGLGLTYKFI